MRLILYLEDCDEQRFRKYLTRQFGDYIHDTPAVASGLGAGAGVGARVMLTVAQALSQAIQDLDELSEQRRAATAEAAAKEKAAATAAAAAAAQLLVANAGSHWDRSIDGGGNAGEQPGLLGASALAEKFLAEQGAILLSATSQGIFVADRYAAHLI